MPEDDEGVRKIAKEMTKVSEEVWKSYTERQEERRKKAQNEINVFIGIIEYDLN